MATKSAAAKRGTRIPAGHPEGFLEAFANNYCNFADTIRAVEAGEVPCGAIIVKDGEIIGKAHNQTELLKDPTAHAEILAITQAAAALENWRLTDAVMYVTKEPCPMCAGAIPGSASSRRRASGRAERPR